MIKLNSASLLWKCLSIRPALTTTGSSGSGQLLNKSNGTTTSSVKTESYSGFLSSVFGRNFVTNEPSAAGASSDLSKAVSELGTPPKRAPNVFALYVKSAFKRMPADMPLKEKFVKAAEEWRVLSNEQKDEYKKEMTDGLVRYRQDMAAFLNSMSPEALTEFKKLRKVGKLIFIHLSNLIACSLTYFLMTG